VIEPDASPLAAVVAVASELPAVAVLPEDAAGAAVVAAAAVLAGLDSSFESLPHPAATSAITTMAGQRRRIINVPLCTRAAEVSSATKRPKHKSYDV